MKKVSSLLCALSVLAVTVASVVAFEIKFNLKVFDFSSDADTLTMNTSVAYYAVDYVWLDIGDKKRVRRAISPDSSERLVVRCGKDALREAVGDFDSLSTETMVMITIDCDGVVDSAFKVLRINNSLRTLKTKQ